MTSFVGIISLNFDFKLESQSESPVLAIQSGDLYRNCL